MNNKRLLSTIALALGVTLCACGNDNGGDAGTDMGMMGCNVEANYTSLHDNLFSSATCSDAACHIASTAPNNGGLELSGGAMAVHNELLGEPPGNSVGAPSFPNRVVANNSAMSYLYHKVIADPPMGGARMPIGPPLQQCQIDAIQTWIDNGAAQ